jgi:putative nucleotidyltransferase with HDIG domain
MSVRRPPVRVVVGGIFDTLLKVGSILPIPMGTGTPSIRTGCQPRQTVYRRRWGVVPPGTLAGLTKGVVMTGHILALDDEPGVRALLSTWLQSAGLRCSPAATTSDALALYDRDPADVALIDLRLGADDGMAAARGLRAKSDDLAIVLVTGYASFDAAVEGLRLGVMDYLLKPFTRNELLTMVKRALNWRAEQLRQRADRDGFALEIQQRRSELSEAFARIEVASIAAIDALLTTLSRSSPETFEHAKRVAHIATLISSQLGMSDIETMQVERGALLHDIGKVALPDAIIYKPGPLTEAEMAIMRTHPQIGHDIVAAVPALRPAAQIILASHERWDGLGYPAGLSGTSIPVGARVASVADVFDVLTSPRNYRDPVSADSASTELTRCAGTQFDPDVVRACLRVVECIAPGGTWRTVAWNNTTGHLALGKIA